MPTIYFDTCALAKRYYHELGHRKVKKMVGVSTNKIVLSNIGAVEMASVLRKKFRQGNLTERNVRLRLLRFIYDGRHKYNLHPVTSNLLTKAIGLISKHELHSLDAIHLATAQIIQGESRNFQFVTSDRNLYKAADAEGMHPVDPQKSASGHP